MKGYSLEFDTKECASARLEGVDASYKDLSEVCGRIRRKNSVWALTFLEKAAAAEIPVLYRTHNTKLGHRRELGGKQGRYPKKAAGIVLKVLESAIANGMAKSLGEVYTIHAATANKKFSYPRMAPKGRTARSYYELSRIEIVLKPSAVKTEKKDSKPEAKKDAKPESNVAAKPQSNATAKPMPKTAAKPEPKREEKAAGANLEPKREDTNAAAKADDKKAEPRAALPHEHKHEMEKEGQSAHAHHDQYAVDRTKARKTEINNAR
jgi:large subunit ribosomal protein L22